MNLKFKKILKLNSISNKIYNKSKNVYKKEYKQDFKTIWYKTYNKKTKKNLNTFTHAITNQLKKRNEMQLYKNIKNKNIYSISSLENKLYFNFNTTLNKSNSFKNKKSVFLKQLVQSKQFSFFTFNNSSLINCIIFDLLNKKNFSKNFNLVLNITNKQKSALLNINFFNTSKTKLLSNNTNTSLTKNIFFLKKLNSLKVKIFSKKKVLKKSFKFLKNLYFYKKFNMMLINNNKSQVTTYQVSENDFKYLPLLRIKNSDSLYNSWSFKKKINNLNNNILNLNTFMTLATNDNNFENILDFNITNKKVTNFIKKNINFRKIFYKNLTKVLIQPSVVNTPLTIDNKNPYLNTNLTLLKNHKVLHKVLENNLLFNYLGLDFNTLRDLTNTKNNSTLVKTITTDLNIQFFNSRFSLFSKSNLLPSTMFKFTIKRKLLKVFKFHKFSSNITMWYYNILIRFIENCSGKKVYLKFNPFIENALTFSDLARCNLWASRVTGFQRILGPKIFLNESLQILHLALRFKDPTFLSNWMRGMLQRMSFWKYRLLFRYLKYVMRYLFWIYFPELKFKGMKLRLKGKISVAGNARTRTLLYKIGETSYSTLDNKVISDFSTINTFTGVLGFKVWFFF